MTTLFIAVRKKEGSPSEDFDHILRLDWLTDTQDFIEDYYFRFDGGKVSLYERPVSRGVNCGSPDCPCTQADFIDSFGIEDGETVIEHDLQLGDYTFCAFDNLGDALTWADTPEY